MRHKKSWARTEKQKRKDSFNWKPFNEYERWLRTPPEAKNDHNRRRVIERTSLRKLMIGFDEEEVLFYYRKWKHFRDYFY